MFKPRPDLEFKKSMFMISVPEFTKNVTNSKFNIIVGILYSSKSPNSSVSTFNDKLNKMLRLYKRN